MAKTLKFGSPAWRKKYMKKNRPKRKAARKNIAAGFYDEDGYFHPIRASYDYSPKRAGDPKPKRKNSSHSRGTRYKKSRMKEMLREVKPKKNPPKGWIKANAVRVVRKNGRTILEVKR